MSGQRGFTLLETLVALALLAGVVTTVLVSFNHHLGLVVDDRETTTAMLLARASLESPDFLGNTDSEGDFGEDFPGFKWKKEKTDTSLAWLKRYQLTITWQAGQRTVVMVTYGR